MTVLEPEKVPLEDHVENRSHDAFLLDYSSREATGFAYQLSECVQSTFTVDIALVFHRKFKESENQGVQGVRGE